MFINILCKEENHKIVMCFKCHDKKKEVIWLKKVIDILFDSNLISFTPFLSAIKNLKEKLKITAIVVFY